MSSVHLNESHRLSLEKKATRIATALIEDRLSLTEAVRKLVPVFRDLRLDGEEVFDLVGIDSELDGLPVGSVREHWDRDALAHEDEKRLAYEDRVRNEVIECCRAVIARFGSTSE